MFNLSKCCNSLWKNKLKFQWENDSERLNIKTLSSVPANNYYQQESEAPLDLPAEPGLTALNLDICYFPSEWN